MSSKKYIAWFEEVDREDIGKVGGKGANLGEMTQAGFPVPYGFFVTSDAYFSFVERAHLAPRIKDLLHVVNYENPHELDQAAHRVQDLLLKTPMPRDISDAIIKAYHEFGRREEAQAKHMVHNPLQKAKHILKSVYSPPLVAVRSSATAEDLPNASFAGQQETYLNVKGESNLIESVRECWASLFTPRAVYYRHENKFDHFKVGLSAVVQRMIQSDVSGIGFSIDPVTNNKSKMVLEAIFGLGEYIVQGKLTPDHYEVDKHSFVILNKQIAKQKVKYVRATDGNHEVKIAASTGERQKLNDKQIVELALLLKDVEAHYFFPQDIEWAVEGGKLYIVQARPITTMKATDKATKEGDKKSAGSRLESSALPILIGAPASPGLGIGRVVIAHSPADIDKVHSGDVLVAPQTNPDYVPAMKKAAAIVTEKGGRTSHAAIVSRELGIPAVVGAPHATHILKHDMIVSVNGTTGEVFKGSVRTKMTVEETKTANKKKLSKRLKTKTKVYVNLAEPEHAAEIAKMHVDGIGLLRAEFLIAQIGEHPKEFIKHKREHEFIRKLTHGLTAFTKAFYPRPIIYRATDFKTNEYRNLKGGAQYEPHEENPMIGFRGASRYIANPEVFQMELEAIKYLWKMKYDNIHLMIPFVRRPWELIQIKKMVEKAGLFEMPGFRLLIMVEVPAAALELEEFLKIGVDGVSIGTNDLTMMLLGVDRDNEAVADLYDERTSAVTGVLEHIVKVCAKYNVSCSICGQAASDYPDLVEKLVNYGITSVSVNADALDRTRELIYEIERRSVKK